VTRHFSERLIEREIRLLGGIVAVKPDRQFRRLDVITSASDIAISVRLGKGDVDW
jgi:hypothetical protein